MASWYDADLAGLVTTPYVKAGNRSSCAPYTARSPQRARLVESLNERGIPLAIHYPRPLHKQEVYAALGIRDESLPGSDTASQEVFSLPMHPVLTREEVKKVGEVIQRALR